MGAALLGDGRIVIGSAAGIGDRLVQSAALIRLEADGSPDETLAPGGIQTFSLGRGSSAWHAATLQLDGKLLLGGPHLERDHRLGLRRHALGAMIGVSFRR